MRSRLPLTQATSTITALAREVHPSIVVEFRTMQSQVRDSLMRERLMATLSGFFGALAALIATIGLYGVMSHYAWRAAATKSAFGWRLGADRREVVGMVMREAGRLLRGRHAGRPGGLHRGRARRPARSCSA